MHPQPDQAAHWTSFDGTKFPYSRWAPAGSAKAVVILVPGWDASMMDYTVLAKHLAAHGYLVYGSEQRTGAYDPKPLRRGNPANREEWVRDLEAFTALVARRHRGLPIFYHGHSFGTVVAMEAAAERKDGGRLRGLVLQSVAMPFIEEHSTLEALAGAAPCVQMPHLRLIESTGRGPTGSKTLNCQWLRSPDRVAEGYKLRYFKKVCELGHEARASSRSLRLPVLALEGEKDQVVAPQPKDMTAYDRYLRQELCGGKAKVIAYGDGYHTMTITPTGDAALDRTTRKALADITSWLDAAVRR